MKQCDGGDDDDREAGGKNSRLSSKIQGWLALLLQSKKMFSLLFSLLLHDKSATTRTSALLSLISFLSLVLSPTALSSSYRFPISICQDYFHSNSSLSPPLSPALFLPPWSPPSLETCTLVKNYSCVQGLGLWVGGGRPHNDTLSLSRQWYKHTDECAEWRGEVINMTWMLITTGPKQHNANI